MWACSGATVFNLQDGITSHVCVLHKLWAGPAVCTRVAQVKLELSENEAKVEVSILICHHVNMSNCAGEISMLIGRWMPAQAAVADNCLPILNSINLGQWN